MFQSYTSIILKYDNGETTDTMEEEEFINRTGPRTERRVPECIPSTSLRGPLGTRPYLSWARRQWLCRTRCYPL
ncbi:hypothetical protein K435DRAFT_778588 [Dendrothele bispora CBS 962.96]|uniref:Uncharacterized protein n=1 Tax=Dendrothele bispora (strain CBS 962.96) TaxID=1314807 RepID=A0A4S8M3L6_DENBC|nr:hypothetical protein K435DRAFT_778588 [Dendrothele bispora CBS 962.96]